MDFNKVTRRLVAEAEERKILRIALLAMIGCNVIIGMQLAGKDTKIVYTPPVAAEDQWASNSTASVEYLKSWALYVAGLAGNVSPGNADFVAVALGKLFVPSIYKEYQEVLTQQVETIRKGNVTLSFEVKQVVYEPEHNMYYVTGEQVRRAVGVQDERKMKTYEMKFRVSSFRPLVTNIDAYIGTADLKRARQVAKNGENDA